MLRGAVIGAGALTLIAMAAPAQAVPAGATTAPTAPYTALVLDGHQGSWLLNGTLSFDGSNATLTSSPWRPNGMTLTVSNASHNWTATLAPPEGSTWSAGTTYTLTSVPNSTDAFFSIGGDGHGCNEPGTLTVEEATSDSASNLIAFAGSFTVGCENATPVLSGEIRWNSSIGFTGATTSAAALDYGSQPATVTGPEKTVTYTATGSDPVTFGAASFTGTNPDAFSITGNTCSSATLSYGQTCTVSVTVEPTALGAQSAYLSLADNTASGHKYVGLATTGTDPRSVSLSSAYLDFGRQDVGVSGPAKVLTLTAGGPQPVAFKAASVGGTNASSFSITADTCSHTVLNAGSSCTISVAPHPGGTGQLSASLAIPGDSMASLAVPLYANAIIGAMGTYYPLPPARILDTRTGLGASKGAVGAGGTVHLQVLGQGGVPSTGVSAVVLNVTVTAPSAASYLTVYPDGGTRPTASSLNFPAGWTGANSVNATVGSDGKVAVYNAAGSTQIIADVVGYYGGNDSLIDNSYGVGGQFQPVKPQRILDTRTLPGGARIPGGYYLDIPVDYGTAYNSHIRALVVNVTAVQPTSTGYLAAWNGLGSSIPSTSTLDYTAGKIVPNMAVVPTAACENCGGSGVTLPMIGVYTSASTHILVDIVGVYDDGTLPDGLRYNPLTPTRIVDSRTGLGTPTALGENITATITAPGSVLSVPDTEALAMNVTAISPSLNTYLTVWPDGFSDISRPTVSYLNPAQGQTIPNAVDTLIGPANAFDIYNARGSVNVVVDVVGTFYLYPGTASFTSQSLTEGAHQLHATVPTATVHHAH